jgi:hypothetical protein
MSKSKGTILFISYYFPPLRAIACVRTGSIAKYLCRAGWNVKVVTPHRDHWAQTDQELDPKDEIENLELLSTGYHAPFLSSDTAAHRRPGLNLIGRLLGNRLYFHGVEPMVGWHFAARSYLKRLIPGSIDVVLASGWPFGSFSLAEEVASRQRCPFVLDYRDLWTSNPFNPYLNTSRNRDREIGLLGRCAAAVVVSPHMREVLRRRHDI